MLHTTNLKRRQHALFKTFQKLIIFLARLNFVLDRVPILIYGARLVHRNVIYNSHANDQVIGVIICDHDIQIRSIFVSYLIDNLTHSDLLVEEYLLIQLDAENPRRQSLDVVICLVTHFVVIRNKLFIHFNNRILDIRIIINFSQLDKISKNCVLKGRVN